MFQVTDVKDGLAFSYKRVLIKCCIPNLFPMLSSSSSRYFPSNLVHLNPKINFILFFTKVQARLKRIISFSSWIIAA